MKSNVSRIRRRQRNLVALVIPCAILAFAVFLYRDARKDVSESAAQKILQKNSSRQVPAASSTAFRLLAGRHPNVMGKSVLRSIGSEGAGSEIGPREMGPQVSASARQDLSEIPSLRIALAESVPVTRNLFENGLTYLYQGEFVKSRLAFQTLIRSFPGCKLEAPAYLACGISYFREGGTANLMIAADQFKNYMLFFPAKEGMPELFQAAQINLAAAEIQLMQSAANEKERWNSAVVAAKTLAAFLNQWPDNPQAPAAHASLWQIQAYLSQLR